MAYLDLSHPSRQLAAPRGARTSAPAPASFTPLERQVIEIARREASAPGGPVQAATSGLVARLAGIRPRPPLANPQLEALRRFASLASAARVRESDVERFLSAGFTPAQARALMATPPPAARA